MRKTYRPDGETPAHPEQIQRHRALWSAVLLLAITDLSGKGHAMPCSRRSKSVQQLRNFWKHHTRDWVKSDANHAGSFVWICGVLDLDHVAVRERLLTSKFRVIVTRGGWLTPAPEVALAA